MEAVRGGEAGRGSAVVAQEVRELAQRSANAANDIKTLIAKSSEAAADGVDLVKATGGGVEQIKRPHQLDRYGRRQAGGGFAGDQ